MHDYKQYASRLSPIEEKDLILFDMSPEEKAHAVKQYNRALMNSLRDGTDVAQIMLKPLIAKYPSWGDPALLFGICLAKEEQFARAESAFEFAVNATLGSGNNLTVAQEAIKAVREDMKTMPPKPETPRSSKNWTSLVAEDGKPSGRTGMQAPILVRASNRTHDFQMATDKERRDVMMRSASAGDEMPGDDIDIESVRTKGDNMRLAVRIAAAVLIIAAAFALIWFLIIPGFAKLRNSSDTEARLDYIIGKLEENKEDPEVAGIIEDYAEEFGDGSSNNDNNENSEETAEETAEVTAEETAEETAEVSEEDNGGEE